MKAYIKKVGHFYTVFQGLPENHSKDNPVLGEYLTRRQALRHAARNGHDVIIRGRDDSTKEQPMKETLNIYLSTSEFPDKNLTEGEWLHLPVDKEDIDVALMRMGVYGGEYNDDYFITAFESSIPVVSRLPIEFIQRKSISDLNELAEQFENHDPALIVELNAALEDLVEQYNGKSRLEPYAPDNFHVPPFTRMDKPMEQLSFDSIAGATIGSNTRPARQPNTNKDMPDAYDRMKEIMVKLEKGIKDVFESDKYRNYLDTLSKFHKYSYGNCVLIAMQKPNATHVAGFESWKQNFNRFVKRGEKAIKIVAPAPYETVQQSPRKTREGKPVTYKDGTPIMDNVKVTMPGYKIVNVFDINQTYGEPLPELGVEKLTGDVDKYKDFTAALTKVSPVPITFENIEGNATGFYDQVNKRIAIQEGMSQQQNLKTMIHEIAHARIHDIDLNTEADQRPGSETREVQAESIAYTVCQHYGIDTSQYSFAYVALWSGDKEIEALKASLGTIRKEANSIINEIDSQMRELQKEAKRETQDIKPEAPKQEAKPEPPPKPKPPTKAEPQPEKKGIRSELAAAKKQAEAQKAKAPGREKTNKKDVEITI